MPFIAGPRTLFQRDNSGPELPAFLGRADCFRLDVATGFFPVLNSTADALDMSRVRYFTSEAASLVKICVSCDARETETYANRLFMSSGWTPVSTWTSTRFAVSPWALCDVTA